MNYKENKKKIIKKLFDSESIVKGRQKRWEEIYKITHNEEVLDVSKCEIDGGCCPRCGISWQKEEIKNEIGSVEYYKPICDCFIKCPKCGTYLYEEEISGYLKNRKWVCECGWKLITDAGIKQYGKAFEASFYKELKEAGYKGFKKGNYWIITKRKSK